MDIDKGALGFAILGGITLGVATSINYILRGRPTGMSGIAYGIIFPSSKSDFSEKITIFGGMLLASSLFYKFFGTHSYGGFEPFGPTQSIGAGTSLIGFAIAGFLVGFGTKLSNGCTSGHGLCGLPRFSLRSLAAVCTFFATGVAVSTAIHSLNISLLLEETSVSEATMNNKLTSSITLIAGLVLPIVGYLISSKINSNQKSLSKIALWKDHLIQFIVGFIFSSGLMIAGMSKRSNIVNFLNLKAKNWNPALLFVFTSALLFNFVTFPVMIKKKISLNGNEVFNPQNSLIDRKLITGAMLFGAGWGIAGICPGPYIVLLSAPTFSIIAAWGSMFVAGLFFAGKIGIKIGNKKNQ